MKKNIHLNKLNSITDEHSAYTLGYIAWAGGLNQKFDRFIMQVCENDKPDLFKIKNILKGKSKVFKVNSSSTDFVSYKLKISANGLVKTLTKWYFTKTDKKAFPQMPKTLNRHFVRGFYERHGYLTTKDMLKITVPSKLFAEGLMRVLKAQGIRVSYSQELKKESQQLKDKTNATVHRVWVYKNSINSFYEFIYKDISRPHRKKQALLEFINKYKLQRNRRKERVEFLKMQVSELDDDGLTVYQISKKLRIRSKTVQNYLDYLDFLASDR